MKGPGMRLDLDARRAWRCSHCGAERRTPGTRTNVTCHVCGTEKLMSLVEPQRAQRALAPPLDLIIELHPDDVDSSPHIPSELSPEAVVSTDSPDAEVIETTTSDPSDSPSQESTKSKRSGGNKKSRRRSRQRSRKGKESKPDATSDSSTQNDVTQSEADKTPAPKSTTDSFGDGL